MMQALEEARSQIGFARSAGYLAVAGIAATTVAPIGALIFDFLAIFPISVAHIPSYPRMFLQFAALISPVTFILLPAVAVICLPNRLALGIAAPIAGLIGGTFAIIFWSGMRDGTSGNLLLAESAAAGGLVAGAIFSFVAVVAFSIAIPKVGR